jgi:hypothetical protein
MWLASNIFSLAFFLESLLNENITKLFFGISYKRLNLNKLTL